MCGWADQCWREQRVMTLGSFMGAPTGSAASLSEPAQCPWAKCSTPPPRGHHLAGAVLRVRLRGVPGFSLSNMRWSLNLDCMSIVPDYSISSLAQLYQVWTVVFCWMGKRQTLYRGWEQGSRDLTSQVSSSFSCFHLQFHLLFRGLLPPIPEPFGGSCTVTQHVSGFSLQT